MRRREGGREEEGRREMRAGEEEGGREGGRREEGDENGWTKDTEKRGRDHGKFAMM